MKRTLLYVFIIIDLVVRASSPDTLARRKHFAIEADVAYAKVSINPHKVWPEGKIASSLKAPGFMCYNFAFVYNMRGFSRDCDDPVHEFSLVGGASIMKMKVVQTMNNYQINRSGFSSNVFYGTEKINYTFNPTELCLLFRYTYTTRKWFFSVNAGVSKVFVKNNEYTNVSVRADNTYTTSSGTSSETIYTSLKINHYLILNKSTNGILGIRVGLNGKRFNPYFTIQSHEANTYICTKYGIGAMILI